MNAPNNKDKKIPEWNIFERLDEVENIALELMDKTATTEPTLKKTTSIASDARTLAVFAFLYGFVEQARHSPSRARRYKDMWIEHFKKTGVSKETLDVIDGWLVAACKDAESRE